MPRYFFDVADGVFSPDSEGSELDNLEQARFEAVRLAGALLGDNPAKFWQCEDWFVEVKDDHGLVLFTLAAMATEAHLSGA